MTDALEHIPPTARAIIKRAAEQYEVQDPSSLLRAAPRDPEICAARSAAITRLSNELLDGEPRWPIARLQGWFNVSRASINRWRARSKEYAPRREREPRNKGT